MKKNIVLLFSIVAILGLSGCGSDGYHDDYYNELTTLFLVDDTGAPYANVDYRCDSMAVWSSTPINGEFSFYPGESCEFDFYGLNGDDLTFNPLNDIVRIVDDLRAGKGGIPYDCLAFSSTTFSDGHFEYDIDDQCVFYL